MRQAARDLKHPILSSPGRVSLPVAAGEQVVSIHASGYHSIAITSRGRVITLGHVIDSTYVDDLLDEGGEPIGESRGWDEDEEEEARSEDPEGELVLEGDPGGGHADEAEDGGGGFDEEGFDEGY